MSSSFREMRFGTGLDPIESYDDKQWNVGETRSVEFFSGTMLTVSLISVICDDLDDRLREIDDGDVIALDLEWDDDLCLFQFCSSRGVLVIRHPKGPGNKTLSVFLGTHKFYAKGIENDKKMLFKKFNETFVANIEDIAATRLQPYRYPVNFMKMTKMFAGEPMAQFKDKEITLSNWGAPILTVRQVLYAAFDVVALFVCYPNFRPALYRSLECEQRLVWRPVETRPTFSYILKNYKKSVLTADLRRLFAPEQLDYVYSWNGMVFVSLYEPLDGEMFDCEIRELEQVDHTISTNCDDFYVTEVPVSLQTKPAFNMFLYAFGVDQSVNITKKYVQISSKSALMSHRIRTFLPNVVVDGMTMKLHSFISFSSTVWMFLPPEMSEIAVREMLENIGTVKRISYDRTRGLNANVEMLTKEEANSVVDTCDAMLVDGFAIRAMRCVSRKHAKHIRKYYQVFVSDCKDAKELRCRFSVFGTIYTVFYDTELDISVVHFMSKYAAMKALSETSFMAECGTRISIEGVSCGTAKSRVLSIASSIGRVISIWTSRTTKTNVNYNVIYESATAARDAYSQLNKVVIDGIHWNVKWYTAKEELPQRVVKSKRRWLVMKRGDHTNEELIEMCGTYGAIIDTVDAGREFFVMFESVDRANAALRGLHRDRCASYLTQWQIALNTNARDIHVTSIEHVQGRKKDKTKLVIVIDPLPPLVDAPELERRCCKLGVPVIVPSTIHIGRNRAVIFRMHHVRGKNLLGRLTQIALDAGEQLPALRIVEDVARPDGECKVWESMFITVDPVPDDFPDDAFQSRVETLPALTIHRAESESFHGKDKIVIESHKKRPLAKVIKFFRVCSVPFSRS